MNDPLKVYVYGENLMVKTDYTYSKTKFIGTVYATFTASPFWKPGFHIGMLFTSSCHELRYRGGSDVAAGRNYPAGTMAWRDVRREVMVKKKPDGL